MILPERAPNRLQSFDYSQNGAYFVTICTDGMRRILSEIKNSNTVLLPFGTIAEQVLLEMNGFYSVISIDKYVIMPNHIHLIITISAPEQPYVGDDLRASRNNCGHGSPGTSTPTISQLISTFKRFCNKRYGRNIWQRSFYDHIIRSEEDYITHLQYINENPVKWENDEYY